MKRLVTQGNKRPACREIMYALRYEVPRHIAPVETTHNLHSKKSKSARGDRRRSGKILVDWVFADFDMRLESLPHAYIKYRYPLSGIAKVQQENNENQVLMAESPLRSTYYGECVSRSVRSREVFHSWHSENLVSLGIT